ncbi:hypothetical protein BGX28_001986, partial [Mortierella sp. GBA30]
MSQWSSTSRESSNASFRNSAIRHPSQTDFTRYYDLALGKLPPVSACVAAGLVHLARIPLRDVAPLDEITSLHKHFFARTKTEGDTIDDTGEVWWYCRVLTD